MSKWAAVVCRRKAHVPHTSRQLRHDPHRLPPRPIGNNSTVSHQKSLHGCTCCSEYRTASSSWRGCAWRTCRLTRPSIRERSGGPPSRPRARTTTTTCPVRYERLCVTLSRWMWPAQTSLAPCLSAPHRFLPRLTLPRRALPYHSENVVPTPTIRLCPAHRSLPSPCTTDNLQQTGPASMFASMKAMLGMPRPGSEVSGKPPPDFLPVGLLVSLVNTAS